MLPGFFFHKNEKTGALSSDELFVKSVSSSLLGLIFPDKIHMNINLNDFPWGPTDRMTHYLKVPTQTPNI